MTKDEILAKINSLEKEKYAISYNDFHSSREMTEAINKLDDEITNLRFQLPEDPWGNVAEALKRKGYIPH